MEEKDFSWKESKISTRGGLGKIIPIPAKDNTVEEGLPHIDAEADVLLDAVKRRITSVLSEELHNE